MPKSARALTLSMMKTKKSNSYVPADAGLYAPPPHSKTKDKEMWIYMCRDANYMCSVKQHFLINVNVFCAGRCNLICASRNCIYLVFLNMQIICAGQNANYMCRPADSGCRFGGPAVKRVGYFYLQ